MVVLPGYYGNVGILENHSPMIMTLKVGLINVYIDDKITNQIFISGGFSHISAESCKVLAEESIFVEELTSESIETFIERIRKEIAIAQNEEDQERLHKDLAVAYAKQQVLNTLEWRLHHDGTKI